MAENDDETIEEIKDAIFLSADQEEMIANNPAVFAEIWRESKQAILIKHWPLIMLAQVKKAKKGDTASAKFLTDFIEELATTSASHQQAPLAWEEKALKLRDRSGLEISAEILVDMVLAHLETMGDDQLRLFLTS